MYVCTLYAHDMPYEIFACITLATCIHSLNVCAQSEDNVFVFAAQEIPASRKLRLELWIDDLLLDCIFLYFRSFCVALLFALYFLQSGQIGAQYDVNVQ